jgi:dTDP-4-amino-4,6-dideoxygalactose transaminase
LRDHGQVKKYYHSIVGWNGRMDGIQGAILQVKLKYLERANEARRAHARHYHQLLEGVFPVVAPVEAAYARHVYHVYAVRVPHRDRVLAAMGQRGVACGIHYPIPVHFQEAYKHLGLGKGSFPVAEQCADEFLSLPMFPELLPEHVETVVKTLRECLVSGSSS